MSTASGPRSAFTGTSASNQTLPLITVIGAGPAGLAAGFYAQKSGLSYRILEGSGRVGGNAATLRHGPFLYDTGAHRWHDQLPDITADIKELLGDELMQINVPSQIYSRGKFFDFPLSPLNLLLNLGLGNMVRAIAEVAWQKLQPRREYGNSFAKTAVQNYGPSLAQRFLLGYSEKLWGAPVEQLSPAIAGKRLKGLNLKTFLLEALKGAKAKTQHLDGSFYYPKYGIGMIAEKMADSLEKGNLQLNQRIEKVFHKEERITGIGLANGVQMPVRELVSTLPLTGLLKALDPPASPEILDIAEKLHYRHLILVVLFLKKRSVTPNASVYFPDPALPFTRLYEPRNRSLFMAPKGQTSVCIEIPTSPESTIWSKPDSALISETAGQLTRAGFFSEDEMLGSKIHRIPFAYPVLLGQSEDQVEKILTYLSGFKNLHLLGRTASFKYTHLHDHFSQAKALINRLKKCMHAVEQIDSASG